MPTQSGKSEIVSIIISLIAIFYPNERILTVSYTQSQSEIIFRRTKDHLLYDNLQISKLIDLNAKLTETEINMNNGTQIRCKSVALSSRGESLLGFDATVLIIDESGSIDDDIYQTKLMRMIVARGERISIEIGTPHTKNHFEKSFRNTSYHSYKIGWEEAVSEGQLNAEEVFERKRNMSTRDFDIWYNCNFPEEEIERFFSAKLLEESQFENLDDLELGVIVARYLGVDVARFGNDLTVYTIIDVYEHLVDPKKKYVVVKDIIHTSKKPLTDVIGRIQELHKKWIFNKISIDAVGVGGGVYDVIAEKRELRERIVEFQASRKAIESDKFLNKKAEVYQIMLRLLEQGLLKINKKHNNLIEDMLNIDYEYTSSTKKKIVDPPKSPDFCDSLSIAVSLLGNPLKSKGSYGIY